MKGQQDLEDAAEGPSAEVVQQRITIDDPDWRAILIGGFNALPQSPELLLLQRVTANQYTPEQN